jgi:hypothetical protein
MCAPIILVNNQLDTQFLFLICLFQFSTCFKHTHAHRQENQLYRYDIWYMSLCVGARLVSRSLTCILDCIYLSEAKAQAV